MILTRNIWFWFQKTISYKFFVLANLKNRVSVENIDKISVIRSFLDPIKNRVSVKSVYVEAVYLEVLLYTMSAYFHLGIPVLICKTLT